MSPIESTGGPLSMGPQPNKAPTMRNRPNRSESAANRDMAAGIRRVPRPAPRSPRWSLPVVTAAKWAGVAILVAAIVGEFIR